ncbi:hypothetical protein [Roseovarius sp. D0-M9]|uniref:hypothetical protein n=1 Tax=Roseovarius sp. D0-M9 TaxID=3127117 RepID=UPI00301012A9
MLPQIKTASTTASTDLIAPETQELVPAYVYRCASPIASELPLLDNANPGEILALISGYKANFEQRSDLYRVLEGFYVADQTGPAFRFYDQLSGASREQGAQLALERIFLGDDIQDDVLRREMVPEPMFYQMLVVTFADARIIIDSRVIRDPLEIMYALEEDPDLAPCVIEISGEQDDPTLIAKARRYVEIVRSLLQERQRPESLHLDLRLGSEHTVSAILNGDVATPNLLEIVKLLSKSAAA